jgi:hypothetical protein
MEGETPEDAQPVEDDTVHAAPSGVTPQAVETAPIEPNWSLGQFAGTIPMGPAAMAALRAWMRVNKYDAFGYYRLAEWQDYYQRMLTD